MSDDQHLAGQKVLVVDDIQSMRGLIKACLADLGIAVENMAEAPDGKSALSMMQIKRYDLIVCDWDMPTMDGLELLKAVRADERLASQRFLMLTANVHASNVAQAIAAGVDDYVAKPFKPEILQTKVSRLLAPEAAAPSAAGARLPGP